MESILTSIKKLLGIAEEYEHFDADIIMHINTVFMTLTQLGVGPSAGFYIEDEEAIWEDFLPDRDKLQAIKTYIYLRVRLLFDPSSLGSATLSAYERQIQELEWRLNIAGESYKEDDYATPSIPESINGTVVDCVKLNVRSSPSSSSSVVHILDVGAKVMIDTTRMTDNWYYIYTSDGIRGYCLKTNIRIHL